MDLGKERGEIRRTKGRGERESRWIGGDGNGKEEGGQGEGRGS
jgi:hypothetical protein